MVADSTLTDAKSIRIDLPPEGQTQKSITHRKI